MIYYADLLVNGLALGCLYAMASVGLTLIYGLLRILHIAHAGVFTLGAMIGISLTNLTSSLVIGVTGAICLSMIAGCLMYRMFYERILREPPHVAVLISIGLLIVMEDSFRIIFGEEGITLHNNPFYLQTVDVAGIQLNVVFLALAATAVITLTALAYFVNGTRVGIAWRATVSKPLIAASFGVDVVKVRYLAFGIGSMLAAIAGVMVAVMNNLVEPSFGSVVSYKSLAIIVLGGLGNMNGALLASLCLGLAESFGTAFFDSYLDRNAIAALVLIVVLMVRPSGFGRGTS